jgi:hypothetical protein
VEIELGGGYMFGLNSLYIGNQELLAGQGVNERLFVVSVKGGMSLLSCTCHFTKDTNRKAPFGS